MAYREPTLVERSYNTMIAKSLQDELYEKRVVLLQGDICSALADSVISQMLILQEQDASSPITLLVNSRGGEISSGLAIYDIMQAVTCDVQAVCCGQASSMAAILFAAAQKGKRFILQHSTVMIHDPLTPGVQGSTNEIRSMAEELIAMRDVSAAILSAHTGHTKKQILNKMAQATTFRADEAVAFGLADKVLTSLNMKGQ